MTFTNSLNDFLQAAKFDFHPVVQFDADSDRLCALVLTASNQHLTPELVSDINRFGNYIDTVRRELKAKFLVGGYNEFRDVYARSALFDGIVDQQSETDSLEEPRRLHIGMDIWGLVGTPVFAPLDGMVHSVGFNKAAGDYGATIILQHQLQGRKFYSLYGHLSLRDLQDNQSGKLIESGSEFAHFGNIEENGNWPPHLHFQLIDDIGNNLGDYPGVCRFSERAYYLRNCPDPDLVLQINQHLDFNP